MSFTRIEMYGGRENGHGYTYWIEGIYKVVSYRKGEYHAYFIPEWEKNWGNYVEPEPVQRYGSYWPSLAEAKAACRRHADHYTPSNRTVKRAAAILASLVTSHNSEN